MSILSILKITGLVPSLQQAIIIRSSFVQPCIMEPPCNRINAVTKNENGVLEWRQTQDNHAQYWKGGSAPYYQIRDSVMEGMLSSINLSLEKKGTNIYRLK